MAARSWRIDIHRNPLDPEPPAGSGSSLPDLRDFSQYGINNLGPRAAVEPQPDDPFISVPPIWPAEEQEIHRVLSESQFLHALAELVGPYWPLSEDFGTEWYVAACHAVTNELRRLDL